MSRRAGEFKTNLSGDAAYKSFTPSPLPPNPPIHFDDEMIDLLVKAHKQLSLLDSLSTRIPNVHQFISMYVRKEALMSSQIEGTQATLEDVLDPMISDNVNRDIADVINYVKATDYAISRLQSLPLCNRLIKETHAVLMEGVRGQEKSPGEFRVSQNWIGGQGSSLKNARYIPPTVEDMLEGMSELEKYMNADEDGQLDILVRAALIHYQFETIHPFLDGNGRIGRLLVALLLMQNNVLSTPVLYISYYLKQNRIEYYDRMTEVRSKDNYEQWVKFFLRAIYESASDATETIDKLIALHDKSTSTIQGLGRAVKTAGRVLEYLEANPIIDISKTADALHVTYRTIANTVANLVDIGILAQNSGENRNRTFVYAEYLAILRGGTE